ncbi:hypothetical protein [Kitasatospora acidiphila]|uniref:hypothetical protein n=1 Tax=Kitasatospora acidiphila TaxID=2567942 RepID=UPI003C77E132
MSDVLRDLCDVLHDLSEAERITLLGELGVGGGTRAGGAGEGRPAERVRTPLPGPREESGVVSQIEWV